MTAFSFPTNPTLDQTFTQPDGSTYVWNGYAWVGQSPVDVETLEDRVAALETDIVKKISQGDDAILNSVRSLTEVMADGRVIAGFEVGREYTTSATIFFMDVVATAELLPEAPLGRANYEGTFYFGDPRDAIPAVPPVLGEDGVTEITPGVPEVPAYPGGSVHTSGLVANYQYTVPGTYQITFTPDNPASTVVSGLEVTAIARTGYTISPSVRFDKCDLSLSPAMSGVYHMGDGQAYQAPQPEVPPTTNPDTGEVIDPGSPAVPELPEIAEGVITSDANGSATYYYERAGDFTVRFTPDDLNADVTAGVNIIMPTFYTISASRDDLIASMSVSPDLPGTYYFGDDVPGVPEVPAVYGPHITATPDRVDDGTGTGTFTPGTPYMWTFAIEGGEVGVWNYGDANLTADSAGAFTYPAVGTYAVTFTRSSDSRVSNLSLVVADGDIAQQVSADELISEAIPEVPAIPQGEIAYDGVTPVVYTYPREGTFTIRFAPADGNDNPTTPFTAHVSIPYVISSPEYFMYKALSLSPTCGGYYTMGDGIATVPEVPATYKNRITATPDATPVPYMFTFAVENAPAGSFSYGDAAGTVDALGVFTYPGVGTYTVTFTATDTGIVSNLTLLVSDVPEAQTGALEELTPYAPEVPAVPEGVVETADGTAEYTYPREGDFTITFYPNELSKPVSLVVNCVNRKTYTLTSSRSEMTGTFTSDPALPGTYYFGDPVPEVPEVPAVYKKKITATPSYDPVPLTFIFDTGVPGTYAFGDDVATTADAPLGASQMIYTVAGTYAVTFTETSTGAVSNLSLIVPDVDPVAQTGADEILTDLIPAVPAIPEGTLVSADGTGSYVYPREGTYTIRYVPDDHNYEATTTCVAHTSIPYVISSPEYFLYKSLSLAPTCGGQYRMGDSVPSVPAVEGVLKAHIIATPSVDVPLAWTFTNNGITAFSRSATRKLSAAKNDRVSSGTYSYGDPAATVDANGAFTYPAAGTYTVTFTDAASVVSTMSLTVLDTGSVEQVSPNEWLVEPVPEVPAIPEGVVATTDGLAEYTYPRAGDYTITFEPNELSLPVTLAVTAPARTEYSIVAMRDDRTATLASAPALPGTYSFGDAVAEVPATYGLQMTATPDYANGQWKFNFSNNKSQGGMYAFGEAEATFLSADGTATFTYAAATSVTVSFTSAADDSVTILPLTVTDADPTVQSSPVVELTPLVPAVAEGTLVSTDGTGTYTYPSDGTYTITYTPDDHNYAATTSFVSHASIPYVITPTPTDNKVSLALDIACGGTYYFGDAVAEVPPVLGEDGVTVITPGVPAVPEGTLETADGTGTYVYRVAGTYTITFYPNELSKPVTAPVTVTDPPPPINYILNVAMSGLVANVSVTQ